jgi:hypothetical protein
VYAGAVVWLTPVVVGTSLAFWWAGMISRGRVAMEISAGSSRPVTPLDRQ